MHGLTKSKYKYFCLLHVQFIILFLQSCIAIPTPDHGSGPDLKINKEEAAFIEPRKTSFEDIIIEFGQPSFYLAENRVLAYSWTETEGYFVGVHPMGVPVAGSIPSPHLFLVEIDEDYLVKRSEELEIDRDVDLKSFAIKWSTTEQ